MNILILHAGAELYGADKVLLELLKNIDKNKFTPFVILPSDGDLVKELKKNNINVEILAYPILRRRYFNIKGICKYFFDYIKYSAKLIRFAKEKSIDLIHTNTSAVLEGIIIKFFLRIPQIWHIHEIIVRPKLLNKVLSYIIAKSSDEVVTVSNAVSDHLKDSGYFNKNINVIYNGVDNNKFNELNDCNYLRVEFGIPEDAIIVGMIGRVNSWKGQDDFVKAMDILMGKQENVYSMVVGGVFEGEEWRMDDLKENIKKLDNNDRIILSDYRNDTANLYNLFNIFVLPSINPDPLPTVVLEAMATAKPIVAYNHGGVCEMVVDGVNGFFANVRDINDLASKIEILVEDEQLRKKFSQNSIDRQTEEFSLESYVYNFEELYEKYYR
ncbi:glycosyltransferase family 4 protein [Clostridium sp. AL.422]|uniref:glycosyltransferase family 4 protein n=1 Tax=Clostridium TaxID=1485 RepID=UPI00293DFB0B|nr:MULTISPECIES: glycosyltransferase family 4 protein [unclassified Clostridium]MDV4150394.1 glycosyltransferase family 4 protein [Clostridium sp. AL.422]